MDEGRERRWSWIVAITSLAIAVLGVPSVLLWYYGVFNAKPSPQKIAKVECPRLFDKAHSVLESESPLATPPNPSINFTPSEDLPGRVDLALAWVNPVDVTQSAIAIEGVYGRADVTDYFIDHHQPSAATGECWNWYHYEPRNDAQPKVVRIEVDGLWPEQQYCLYTVFRISSGYSKPTPIVCQVAPWKTTWGRATQAPIK